MFGRQKRRGRGNKKEKLERKKEKARGRQAERSAGRGEVLGPGRAVAPERRVRPRPRGEGQLGLSATSPENLGPAPSTEAQAWVQRFPRALFSPPSQGTTGRDWTGVGRPPGARATPGLFGCSGPDFPARRA